MENINENGALAPRQQFIERSGGGNSLLGKIILLILKLGFAFVLIQSQSKDENSFGRVHYLHYPNSPSRKTLILTISIMRIVFFLVTIYLMSSERQPLRHPEPRYNRSEKYRMRGT